MTRSTNGERATGAARGHARSAIVIGAGVVGLATAYALARRGLAVTVIESRAAPGCEASFANGAQLSYAYSDALASPALLRHIPAVLLGLDQAVSFKPALDPDHVIWLLRFLRNASPGRFMDNTLAALRLGLESQAAMHALLDRHSLDFSHAAAGKLHLHASAESLDAARRMVAAKQAHGAQQQILTPTEARQLEPALAGHGPFAGAIYTPGDEVGDPHRFCAELAALLQADYGVVLRLGSTVRKLGEERGAGWVQTQAGERIAADQIVICAGIGAAGLARRLGLRGLLMPMKGYSFTAPAGPVELRVSVTDVVRKIVLCRLGDQVRVAGLAQIGISSAKIDPAALERLRRGAQASLPDVADYERIGPGWAGLRPMTANSLPRIERVSPRFAVNIGHGMLGWTHAMGSAERLAKVIMEGVE